jgi:uncharacterized membrane protein
MRALIAVLLLGLMAGLFYAYAGSVMPGLRRASDRAAVESMQRINVAIQNPLFFLIFVGSLIFTGIATFQNIDRTEVFVPVLIALVLYVVTLVITGVFNIPLNNQLDRAGDPAQLDDVAAVRAAFFPRWIQLNTLRTLTSTGAFAAGLCALLQY